jgi:23S rRNA (cytosine1962-C5)-methyltransferase
MEELHLTAQTGWSDYELIDSGDGEKLERFGEFIVSRPDPQIIWPKSQPQVWQQAQARFQRTHQDKGIWKTRAKLPEQWPVHWQDLTFMAKLSPFKHTGIFPEQSAHWQWMRDQLQSLKQQQPQYQPHILNLFAYTGGASIVCAHQGAKVTHVDASRSSIGWAKNNQAASGLDDKSIRWILDDVVKFVGREVKRGSKYDGIILDPPVYGHGPQGERWEFKESLPVLLELCSQILVEKTSFILINAYAVSTSAITLGNLLKTMMKSYSGQIQLGELVLQPAQPGYMVSTGIWARWSAE